MDIKVYCNNCTQKISIDESIGVDFNCPSCGEIILIDNIIHKKNEKLPNLVIKKTKVSSTRGKSNIYPKQFVKLDDIGNAKEMDKEHNIAPRLVFIFLGLFILFGIGSIIYKKIFVVREVDVWAEIEKGNTDEIAYYLKHGGDINVTDMYECDMLHNAVTENKLPIAELLINYGIEINNKEPDYSNTPLAIACEFGFFDMAKLLIDNNADYKVKNVDDDTPLLIALKNKRGQYYNIINLLVNKGAKINRLDHAQTILIHLILEERYLAIEDLVKNKNYDINKFNIYGESALHVACVLGNIDLVRLLIENGADVNLISKDQYKHTPLSSLLFYKAFEASVLYKHKNNSMVSEMMPGMMGMGMPGMNPYGMSGMMPSNDWPAMGMSGMMPGMNPYGNPYGMPGMMPGNDLPAMGNAIDISMMNGNITLSKPLSNFNNPSQKSIYSYFINKKIQSNKFDNIETKFKYLIDFDESPHSKILKYLRNTNANIDDSDLNLIKILDQPNDYFNILSTNEAAKVADNKLRRTNSGYIPAYPTKWRSFASFGSNDDKYMEIGKPIRIFKNQGGELKLVAGFGGVDGNVSIPIENKKFKKIAKIGFGKVEHGKEGTDFINGKAYFVCGIWGPIDEGDKISPIDGFLGYYKIRIEPMRQDSNLNMIDWNPTTHKLIDHETGQEITLLHEPKNQAQRKRGLNPKFVDLIADGRLPWE